MQNENAIAFLSALAGPDAVYDFRAIHDTDKGVNARPLRGTFTECSGMLTAWQAEGFAPHVMINATDGTGREKGNVIQCRAQLLDCDGPMAVANAARAMAWKPAAHMVVNTSPGKSHLWWLTVGHTDKQLFEDNQKRLAFEFAGDKQFIDVAHTARLPGFWHLKAKPHFVTVSAGPGWGGSRIDPWSIAAPLLHIDVKAGASDRKPLGTASMAAPSWDWLVYAVSRIDPNALGFNEWIAITASIKQSGWLFGEQNVRALWEWWCGHYRRNDSGENAKQWNAIDETASGWKALVKSAHIEADVMAAGLSVSGARVAETVQPATVDSAETVITGPILTPAEQASYFSGCFWIDEIGRIMVPSGRLMNAEKFNGRYGGKAFVLDATGSKITDEPWKAALRGQVFTIPKVDHMRFLPLQSFGAIAYDEFGRKGVNTYRKPSVELVAGDIGPFVKHVENMLPNASDREILFAFLAQCVQRPGVKIRWSIVLQSIEGAGKTIFKSVLEHVLGATYVHSPNASELTDGGGKFNGWLRNKLMICVDEIKTDEKMNLIEVLKPMITDVRIEMQNKGQDQAMADNPSNWLMFTNYKDAIPVRKNDRRYCIMYSRLQDETDLDNAKVDGQYYSRMFDWLSNGGASAVGYWLMNYQIPRYLDAQAECTRAPKSSSYSEVVANTRSLIENLIVEAVDSQLQGFRNGWVSTVALNNLIREQGHRVPGSRSIATALSNLGYISIGKAPKPYIQEKLPFQTRLYNLRQFAAIAEFARDQGYN